ncbi:MAG: hypothetical protein P8Z81_10680 [Deinococcales bacterium]
MTMNDGMPPHTVSAPFRAPSAVPMASPVTTASTSQPKPAEEAPAPALITPAVTAPVSAATDPTDRSISANRMTIVAPTAMTATVDACVTMLRRFVVRRKFGLSSAIATTNSIRMK